MILEEGIIMIRQTVFGFKIEKRREALTAHRGLALTAEFNHGLGLRAFENVKLFFRKPLIPWEVASAILEPG